MVGAYLPGTIGKLATGVMLVPVSRICFQDQHHFASFKTLRSKESASKYARLFELAIISAICSAASSCRNLIYPGGLFSNDLPIISTLLASASALIIALFLSCRACLTMNL